VLAALSGYGRKRIAFTVFIWPGGLSPALAAHVRDGLATALPILTTSGQRVCRPMPEKDVMSARPRGTSHPRAIYDDATRTRALTLLAAGKSKSWIARELGCHRWSVARWEQDAAAELAAEMRSTAGSVGQ
jgi:hypothetical protein